MGYRDPIRETAADARRELLDAAVVFGARLDAPEGHVDDEMIVRALSASWTHASATSHRSKRATTSRSVAGPRPRTRATACSRSHAASA
jgi:hypothetical protein